MDFAIISEFALSSKPKTIFSHKRRGLLYYEVERNKYKEQYADKITDEEAEIVFGKLKTRYKLGHALIFRGWRGGGRCTRWNIRVSHNPSVGLMAHELAHGVQYKRKRILDHKKWHTKKHEKIMVRIMGVITKMLPEVRDNIVAKKERKKIKTDTKAQKETALANERMSTDYKLVKINEQLKKWGTKKKRAENAIKKLMRRKKIYEKKVI